MLLLLLEETLNWSIVVYLQFTLIERLVPNSSPMALRSEIWERNKRTVPNFPPQIPFPCIRVGHQASFELNKANRKECFVISNRATWMLQ